ncbi:putative response regulator receiver modulated diguanylate cyclase [Candidatus Terasakiella magnetica]|uniref:Putative response regulator receiver modulated diguanylate cyclase n=1 Tax=Candidatus Terasakiella magnetica TaxID=1867952 RepID=A0A1C3RIW7_9PROT|nr:response regulator [Candidatus Terasakiella magnetica]SCA57209.1 putative response regulator receiver modulated diguanylate cyclase [Candidatus Terasakiella magnetica]
MTHETKPTEILLVEDAKFYRSVIKSQLEKQLGFVVACAETLQEADEILEERADDFFLALLDLNLPDAPNGEIVEHVMKKNIPSVVFSGHFNEEMRDDLMQKRIIDYVLKDSPASIEYVISTVKRLYQNQFVKVLLVDDSKTARFQMGELLNRYKFQVVEAKDGLEGLEVLANNPDVKLVITDYNMPNLDGFEFTKKIRTQYSKRELSIIGVSTYGNHALSAKFIKVGANDFITKPFLNEEFFCRVSQNVEIIDYINAMKESVVTDYLTGLKNRRYFYERGLQMFKESQEGNGYLIAAMMDLDGLKTVNDTYGHDCGDEILRHAASKLRQHFANIGVVTRFSGGEFCAIMYRDGTEDIIEFFENIRHEIETTPLHYTNQQVKTSISIGVTWQNTENLDDLVNLCERFLLKAKEQGGNKVVVG